MTVEKMGAMMEKLDARLRQRKPDIAKLVRQRLAEIIEAADHDALSIIRSRAVEQEVLELLDKPSPRTSKVLRG
jgi:hypothetical protein